MKTTPRRRGASLARRLCALALVPTIALSVFAALRIRSELEAADRAGDVADAVALQQHVSAVYPPAQVENVALEGLARMDVLGLDRGLIVALTGIDFASTYETNRAALDRSLDELQAHHRLHPMQDGDLLGSRLGRIRGALDVQRDLSADGLARTDDVNAVFDDLFALLEEALRTTTAVGTVDDVDPLTIQLGELTNVLVTAGQHGDAMLAMILYGWSQQADAADTAHAVAHDRHEIQLDRFEATLAEPDPALADLRRQLDGIAAILPKPAADSGPEAAAEPSVFSGLAATMLAHFDYTTALDDYAEGFADRVATAADEAVSEANAVVAWTVALLVAVAVATAGVLLFVLWSVLMPVRELTRRASRISSGELDSEPLAVRGPGDIRALTSTMNEMSATLHRVNEQIDRLATDRTDPDDPIDLPGAIGVSTRESVRRLADVTAQLQQSEQVSSAIVSEAADAIWTVDADGVIITANEASARLTQRSVDEQIGTRIGALLSSTEGEADVDVPAGPSPRVLVARSAVDVGDEPVVVLIAHDISERSRFEDRLAYQASHDALTGLPNRFATLEHLERSLEQQEQVAVLFVDLDGFKSVNDVQGHATGDQVLADVATKLSSSVRNEEFVGRLGGDEFVIVSHHFVHTTDVLALGHRIIREIEQPRQFDDQMFVLSASVGVTIPTPGTTAIDALRQADNAVYQAKEHGRGRVELFDAAMQERVDREAELELALRHAVRNDELVIHLQPMFDLPSREADGAEALVRWDRPGHGLVPPMEFIPLAERSSLILEIERWVLTRVCGILVEWREHAGGATRRISVNISGRHLIEGDLLADVDAALTLTGADPSMLELELTETHLLEDLEHATGVLQSLRSRGIRIAVDDFGTGYSSMTYLRHLPIDAVKIDRSFVARAAEHGYDSTVIEALLTIGRTLELTVVAEGIETDEQYDYLHARHCDRAQGFLLARPMPVEDAEAVIFGGVLVAGD